MTKKKLTPWAKGATPMIGEWNASTMMDNDIRRWWNGKEWSDFYFDFSPKKEKRIARRTPADANILYIKWRGLAEKPAGFVPPEPLKDLK